ncbi:hypothetical protein N7517_006084 [Penicillium concentricum]|uniref:Uncharacterized protein n=1 Tax=Penicillium concentricum TaxID=293559 RepID=A0A9W9V9P2_9EURO|nr:uncharacterized protein N7517_006084 [Penicillium concentricum]KAJ5374078.1 hypothetical protein N7517_006084 [Penicillium concentricum]
MANPLPVPSPDWGNAIDLLEDDLRTTVVSRDVHDEADSNDTSVLSDSSDSESARGSQNGNATTLQLRASVGDIPGLRYQLLRPSTTTNEVRLALRTAASHGQFEALEIMLEAGAKYLNLEKGLSDVLIAAARNGHVEFVRRSYQAIKERETESYHKMWAASLQAAIPRRHRTTILTLLKFHPEPSRHLVASILPVIESAATKRHFAAATLLCDWLLHCSDGENQDTERQRLAIHGTSVADPSLLDLCLELQNEHPSNGVEGANNEIEDGDKTELDSDLDGDELDGIKILLSRLLTVALQSRHSNLINSLLVIIEAQGCNTHVIMPSFAVCCRSGLRMVRCLLTRREGKLTLSARQLAIGSYTAAIFGRRRVLHKLLNEQLDRGQSLHSTSFIENALVGAASHGHTEIVKTLINTPRFKDHISDAVMNIAMIVATEVGHLEVVRLCLQEGADALATVQRRALVGHLDPDGGLAIEIPDKDFSDMYPSGFRTWRPRNTQLGAQELSRRSLAVFPPIVWQSLVNSLSSKATTALQAALLGFHRVRYAEATPGFDTSDAVSEKERRQEALVSLIFDQGCEPSNPDGSGESSLEIAVKWGNDRVIERILQKMVFDNDDEKYIDSNDESNANQKSNRRKLVMLATKRDSAVAFRVLLKLLQAGTGVPVTRDGVLIPEILTTLERSLRLMERPDRTQVWDLMFSERHSYTADQARRFMNSGIRTLIELLFSRLPCQRATEDVFHQFLAIAATAGDAQIVKLLIEKGVCEQTDSMPSIEGTAALGGAAQYGHIQVMEALLASGENPNGDIQRNDMQCPLSRAIHGGHLAAVQLLIERGAQLNRSSGNSFLSLALDFKRRDVFECLLAAERPKPPDPSVLVTACADGNADLVSRLIVAGARVNVTAKESLVHSGRSTDTPLSVSCRNGHIEIAQLLLDHGADVNMNSGGMLGIPLVAAASRGHLNIVRLLLENGADPNRQSQKPSARKVQFASHPISPGDNDSESPASPTALSEACKNGFPVIVEILLLHGAALPDVSVFGIPNAIVSTFADNWSLSKLKVLDILLKSSSRQDSRSRAFVEGLVEAALIGNCSAFECILKYVVVLEPYTLVLACVCGSLPSVRQCLDQGIDPGVGDTYGSMPLHSAADHMNVEVVQHLLAHGADVNQLNEDNHTPLLAVLCGFQGALTGDHEAHIAERSTIICDMESIVRCLLEAGARTDIGDSEFGQAIHVASFTGLVDVVRLLLDQGAIVDSPTPYFGTPLFAAIDGDQPGVLSILMERGADPHHPRMLLTSDGKPRYDTPSAANNDAPLQTPLEATIGKPGPMLLRTFLNAVQDIAITERALVVAANAGYRTHFWAQEQEICDFQILLEFDKSLMMSDHFLDILTAGELDCNHGFFDLIVERSHDPVAARELLQAAKARPSIPMLLSENRSSR